MVKSFLAALVLLPTAVLAAPFPGGRLLDLKNATI